MAMANWTALRRIARSAPIIIGLAISACGGRPTDEPGQTTAISNRPQTYDRFIAMLKLKSPALLASARKVEGRVVVDEALKARITAEQESAIAELQAISPDIKVLYRYRMVLNGLAVVAPKYLEARFRQLPSVAYVEGATNFTRLEPLAPQEVLAAAAEDLETHNSVSYIGAHRVHREVTVPGPDGAPVPVDGRGITVGVIDTGIDYTHAMFGGAGTSAAYQAQDKASRADGGYPNAKVTGGVDLVGTDFDSASPRFENHIPKPDEDPIDEGGHGTHVGGTIAGIGNGKDTYTGVAPEAKLHAIKVFGKEGSTNDPVVIAALEYAADPKGDFSGEGRLDVINLSLGSSFGVPHILYNEAVSNLVKGDTVVVASAGNSGELTNIVGAPSTSDDALSVAASIDDMTHNWKFRAVLFKTPTAGELTTEAIEASVSKPISDEQPVSGSLVAMGLLATDLTDAEKALVRGKVALVDRGQVNFAEKIRRAAEAGAIGVVVANNEAGEPFTMGGDGKFEIPAIMISQSLGDTLKAELPKGPVTIDFATPRRIEKPELIDTLAPFSSRGPRSLDGVIKPEIAAPGANIISAKMGGGAEGVKMSGTSMAAPHMAGVMALLKQAKPKATVPELQAHVISTAKPLKDKKGVPYPVAYAGAGRIQVYEAVRANLSLEPATLSLGEVLVETAKLVRREIKLTNRRSEAVKLTLKPVVDPGLTLTLPASVTLEPGASETIAIQIKITPPTTDDRSLELDGFIEITGDAVPLRLPVLAVANRTTRVETRGLDIYATSPADAAGAEAVLTLANAGRQKGEALLFNHLATDDRKDLARGNIARNGVCDLESAGWRVTRTKSDDGKPVDLLQVAVKLYNPVSSWHLCEASIQIDANGDGIPEQELVGAVLESLTTNAAQNNTFVSALTSVPKMREIRAGFEKSYPKVSQVSYTDAVVDLQEFKIYGHSTIAVVQADLAKLALTASGDLRLKLAVLAETSTPESDDYLGRDATEWRTISPLVATSFQGLTDVVLAPGEVKSVNLVTGRAGGSLVAYLPFNQSTDLPTGTDAQAQVAVPRYLYGP